jgi:hypothetical protein
MENGNRVGTTWCPSGELSLPPEQSRIYGCLLKGCKQSCFKDSILLQTYMLSINIREPQKEVASKKQSKSHRTGPRDCPAIYLKRRELTYVLDHTALNRRLKFKEDYVHERHCCGSRREREWRRIIVMDGGLTCAIEDKSERNVIDDY